jgi:hypothetical protein
MRFSLFYHQRWSWLYAPILLLSGILVLFASTQWMPLPPMAVVIKAGDVTSNYEQLATAYRNALEKRGIAASIAYNRSWDDLAGTLNDHRQSALFGFASGNHAKLAPPGMQTLASIAREPVWVFSKQPSLGDVSQIGEAKVAVGRGETSTADLAKLLMTQAGESTITWSAVSDTQATQSLIDGKVSAVFTVGPAQAPNVRDLLRAPGVNLLGVEQAVLLTAREPSLRPFALPRGVIELVGDIPPKDLSMVANLTHIVINESMHPALQRLLMDVATEIHEHPSFLQLHAEFPSTRDVDFKLSPTANSYSLGNKPFLERFFPYWWAQLISLLLLAILPIVAITAFTLLLLPALFDHQVNNMLMKFYGELKFIETDISTAPSEQPITLTRLLQRLDDLERQAMGLNLPDSFADRWYTLREHLLAARHRLLENRGR